MVVEGTVCVCMCVCVYVCVCVCVRACVYRPWSWKAQCRRTMNGCCRRRNDSDKRLGQKRLGPATRTRLRKYSGREDRRCGQGGIEAASYRIEAA